MRSLIATGALLVATAAMAANHAIVFGGNCEQGPGNGFAQPMGHLTKALSENGWKVESLFGKGTEDSNINLFSNAAAVKSDAVQPASKAALLTALDRSLDPISGLHAGDQLFLAINTHGTPQVGDHPHEWCLDRPAGQESTRMAVTDPDFVFRLQNLKERGVKIAISDDSCFPGASIPALKSYGCVLASQTSHQVSYGEMGPTIGIARLLGEKASLSRSKDIFHNSAVTMETAYLDSLAHPCANSEEFATGRACQQAQLSSDSDRQRDSIEERMHIRYFPGVRRGDVFVDWPYGRSPETDSPALECKQHDIDDSEIATFLESLGAIGDVVHGAHYSRILRTFTGIPVEVPRTLSARIQSELLERERQAKLFSGLSDKEFSMKQNLPEHEFNAQIPIAGASAKLLTKLMGNEFARLYVIERLDLGAISIESGKLSMTLRSQGQYCFLGDDKGKIRAHIRDSLIEAYNSEFVIRPPHEKFDHLVEIANGLSNEIFETIRKTPDQLPADAKDEYLKKVRAILAVRKQAENLLDNDPSLASGMAVETRHPVFQNIAFARFYKYLSQRKAPNECSAFVLKGLR